MTNGSNVHEDVEAYVLGALEDADRQFFELHLDHCPSCQREVASYVPILRALREVTLPKVPTFRPPSRPIALRPRVLYSVAAVLALVIAGFGGADVQRTMSSDMVTVAAMGATSVEQVRLRGTDGAEGRAIVGRARRRTAFVVTGLPEAGPNAVYQVWVNNGTTSSAGTLHRSMQGYEILIVSGDVLRGAKTITITREPSGGSQHMTGTLLVTGAPREV
jgi:Anti-sigma-K factor rskA/Putative zinc-finger